MSINSELFLPELLSIEKPARYFGNEAGIVKKTNYDLRFTLCYPDIYEIGMCNNAMRILYSKINKLPGVLCDRVFVPKPDFGELLKKKGIALFALDSLDEICKSDIIGFSIGYELLATNVLYVLDLAGISPLRNKRTDKDPLIIAGGPGITNPEPFMDFFDAVWIGEAESAFFDFLDAFRNKKNSGATKQDLLSMVQETKCFYDGSDKITVRNIHYAFGSEYQELSFPLPSIKPVQEHAVVEIMRGCINGCRFCQAGYTYRPARIKEPEIILEEVEDRVKAGYTSISLSSLSSGDYPNILELLELLTEKYRDQNISFQLPSLKVESFSLEILQHISELKKSGLTFAIETAKPEWQQQINKIVDEQKVFSILNQARVYHFKTAKFYFMLGLPVNGTLAEEAEAITAFLKRILDATSMEIHVAISVFVPKPHTPYEHASFSNPEAVLSAIYSIKDSFRNRRQLKISYHNPYMAYLEYAIAHGDRNLGKIIFSAYKSGCIFDAWDDQFKRDLWLPLLDDYLIPIGNEAYKKINMKVSNLFIQGELKKSSKHLLTAACSKNCETVCGACMPQTKIHEEGQFKDIIANIRSSIIQEEKSAPAAESKIKSAILFSYEKMGTAAFIPHHDLARIFEIAFGQIGVSIDYSKGFHPMPRIEISEPLPLGIQSLEEYGLLYIKSDRKQTFEIGKIQKYLPMDLRIISSALLRSQEAKYQSLSTLMDASMFIVEPLQRVSEATNHIHMFSEYCDNARFKAIPRDKGIALVTNVNTGKIQTILEKCFGKPWRELPLKITRARQFCRDQIQEATPFSVYPVEVSPYI